MREICEIVKHARAGSTYKIYRKLSRTQLGEINNQVCDFKRHGVWNGVSTPRGISLAWPHGAAW